MKEVNTPQTMQAASVAAQKARYGDGYADEMKRRAALATEARKAKRTGKKKAE